MHELKFKVIEKNSNLVLFECAEDEENSAYEAAKKFESFDLDVEIIGPTLPEELILSLGAKHTDLTRLNHELAEEIKDHSDIPISCCFSNKN